MSELSIVDAEYFITPDDKRIDSLILCVKSKSLNAYCALRIDDSYLSQATCKTILRDLKALEQNLAYQKGENNGR